MDITIGCRYWTLKLPQDWVLCNEEDCVTFSGTPDLGALQMSAREKETAVDNDDLREFATQRVDSSSRLHPVVVGSLVGYYAQSLQDETLWREWWLRSGRVMVYITYNVEESSAGNEDDILEDMLSTLRLREENVETKRVESDHSIFAYF